MLSDFEQLNPKLLATNEVFPDEERNTLKQQRAAASQSLAVLNAEIALADLSLSENNNNNTITTSATSERSKRKRRRRLVVLIAACDVATAPHKYLPAELLSYIFALASSSFPTYLPPSGRTNTALILCQTCSRWRKVALDTPNLWADIVFRHERGLDPYRTIDLVEEYFARCGSLKPLSLEILPWSPLTSLEADQREVMQTILRRLIVPYSSRFWNLNLRAPEWEINSFLAMDYLTFPNLKSVRIQCDSSSSSPETHRPAHNASFFATAPLLTDVEIRDFGHRFLVDDSFLACKWSHLIRLCFYSTTIKLSQIQSILRQCRKLEECTLHVSTDYFGEHDNGIISKAQISLPFLHRLDLPFDILNSFLQPLNIPNVKELNISNKTPTTAWPQETLVSFLTGLCGNIEILQIENIHLPEASLSKIARALPSLTTLLIGVDNLLSREIMKHIAGGRLLPQLRCLSCRIDDLEMAIQMVEHRWKAGEVAAASAASEDAASAMVCPAAHFARSAFFMFEYDGQVISRDQALRVDGLRAKGVEISITRF